MGKSLRLAVCLTVIFSMGAQAHSVCENRVPYVAKRSFSYGKDTGVSYDGGDAGNSYDTKDTGVSYDGGDAGYSYDVKDTSVSYANDGSGCYTYIFDGVLHDYIVDLPDDPKDAPLIVMLPGYGESAEGFRRDTGFYKDAVSLGYIVVHVTGAPNPEDRTSAVGWNYNDYDGNNDDVGFLREFSKYIIEQYSADSTRCFAVGYSNGGFMCHRLALEAADTFSAAVCVSGTMTDKVWEQRPDTCDIGFFQITGELDNTIPKNSDGSARYSKFPAIEEVMEYYAAANNLCHKEVIDSDTVTDDLSHKEVIDSDTAANDLSHEDGAAVGRNSYLIRYSKDEAMTEMNSSIANYDKEVWHLVVGEGRHSWPEESVSGINTNQMILTFLEHLQG